MRISLAASFSCWALAGGDEKILWKNNSNSSWGHDVVPSPDLESAKHNQQEYCQNNEPLKISNNGYNVHINTNTKAALLCDKDFGFKDELNPEKVDEAKARFEIL